MRGIGLVAESHNVRGDPMTPEEAFEDFKRQRRKQVGRRLLLNGAFAVAVGVVYSIAPQLAIGLAFGAAIGLAIANLK